MPDQTAPPRYQATLTPRVDGEVDIALAVHAPDVTHAELVHGLLKVALLLAAQPGNRFPTVEEQTERERRAQVLREHPATRLYVREGAQLWLGDVGREACGFFLVGVGWLDAGPVPAGITRPCDWALEPEAFSERHFPARGSDGAGAGEPA
jgi:hypothetical protein